MIRKRLHLQIYATIILSLVLVVVISALTFWVVDEDDTVPEFRTTISTLVGNALPDASTPKIQQEIAFLELLEGMDFDVSLFSQNGGLIASKGKALELPKNVEVLKGWKRIRNDNGWLVELRDGRWLVVGDSSDHDPAGALLFLFLLLSSVALGVGIASYPFVCRLTQRLEKLRSGVEQFGLGNLTARVDIQGKDEIACLAKSFNHSAEQIERLVTTHKTLLANASHELRTPLSRIRLGLELYQDNHDEKRLKALKSDILELDSLIEGILLMSRLDNTSSEITTEDVDLQSIIVEVSERYSGITITGAIGIVSGKTFLLRLVVQNLIANAFKHGAPPVEIELGETNEFAYFTISDNGNGVTAEDHDKIFERFYRGPDKQNVEGYGLGLPMVKQIIETHHGEVEILDKKGFSIQVRLPI